MLLYSNYIYKNNLEKVAHGLYKKQNVWLDELYIMTLKNKKTICSFDTALMLHGLTEREPDDIYLTVPKNYNASHLRSKGINIYQVKEEWLEIGRTTAVTIYGNKVTVYDMERTICDIIRVKSKKDPQMFIYAIKEYLKSSEKDLTKLMKYAIKFNVDKEVRHYLEVLL